MEEALEFEFEDLKPDSATVTMKWEKIAVPFKVAINDAETTMANIRNQMRGRAQYEWEALNQAAQFCLNKKINLDEALKWADPSIQNEERFENLTTKADLLKAMNKPDEAKKIWDQALAKTTAPQLYSYGRRLQSTRKTPKGWRSSRRWRNVIRQLSWDIWRMPGSNPRPVILPARRKTRRRRRRPPFPISKRRTSKLLIDRLQAKQDINK